MEHHLFSIWITIRSASAYSVGSPLANAIEHTFAYSNEVSILIESDESIASSQYYPYITLFEGDKGARVIAKQSLLYP